RSLMGKGVVELRATTPPPREAAPPSHHTPRPSPAAPVEALPTPRETPLRRAERLQALGRSAEALRELRSALTHEPRGPELPALRGALEQLETRLALEAYEEGLRADARRDWGGAAEAYRRALSLAPRNPRYLERVARKLLYQRGDPSEARRLSELAKRLRPDDPEVRVTLGNAYLQAGQNEAALGELDAALRLAPDHRYAKGRRRKLRWGF
ncbi:MAG: tetratricopeptide repeat protein, partial [Deltaproteobacteria bacterium]